MQTHFYPFHIHLVRRRSLTIFHCRLQINMRLCLNGMDENGQNLYHRRRAHYAMFSLRRERLDFLLLLPILDRIGLKLSSALSFARKCQFALRHASRKLLSAKMSRPKKLAVKLNRAERLQFWNHYSKIERDISCEPFVCDLKCLQNTLKGSHLLKAVLFLHTYLRWNTAKSKYYFVDCSKPKK